jgi:hypothetical protein
MERTPKKMTPAEFAVWSYQDYLDEGDYTYKDMMMLTYNLIEKLHYPPAVASDLHTDLYPMEDKYDEPDAFETVLRNIPVNLLATPYPGVYEHVTDKFMDDALAIAVAGMREGHEYCLCDQGIDTDDPLEDPMPSCEDDECPVDDLRARLLHNLASPEVLQLHMEFEPEQMQAAIDYRVRLVYAMQRAELITPGMTAATVKILYDNLPQSRE